MSCQDIPPEVERIFEAFVRKNMTQEEREAEAKREQYRKELSDALDSLNGQLEQKLKEARKKK